MLKYREGNKHVQLYVETETQDACIFSGQRQRLVSVNKIFLFSVLCTTAYLHFKYIYIYIYIYIYAIVFSTLRPAINSYFSNWTHTQTNV